MVGRREMLTKLNGCSYFYTVLLCTLSCPNSISLFRHIHSVTLDYFYFHLCYNGNAYTNSKDVF
jgi:hypothetical protein